MCRLVNIKTNSGDTVRVADIKSVCVQNIIMQAQYCRCISEIILFGSSLEERCTEESDIDIAIISRYTLNYLSRNKDFSRFIESVYDIDFTQEYDRLYFSSLDELKSKRNDCEICDEILSHGKVIYSRQGD